MIEFEHILCPIDLTESSVGSLAHAASLARWYDARLTVLHVVPTFEPMQARFGDVTERVQLIYPTPREDVIAGMRRIADQAGVPEQVSLAAEAGDPATVITSQAVVASADLVVMGTHGHRGVKRLFLGSVTERVLRDAPCPVLTIPTHVRATTSKDVIFKQILCAMDFSPAALQALGFALDLARQANGVVTVLHAIEWLVEEEPRTSAHFNVPEYRRYLIEDARERLQALLGDEPRSWCDIEPTVVVGRAYHQILDAAQARAADLIVMGSQGRGGVGLALFGSTTQHVVRSAACPVLTVRGAQQAQPA